MRKLANVHYAAMAYVACLHTLNGCGKDASNQLDFDCLAYPLLQWMHTTFVVIVVEAVPSQQPPDSNASCMRCGESWGGLGK